MLLYLSLICFFLALLSGGVLCVVRPRSFRGIRGGVTGIILPERYQDAYFRLVGVALILLSLYCLAGLLKEIFQNFF
jgi:hypothetical protein